MTSKEYIDRVLAIGYKVHLNDGVWWIERAPLFYEPVIPYQIIERGTAKPKLSKALLGYSHIVSDDKHANKYESIMLLNEEKLSNFELNILPSKRRNKIRKGLRLTENRKIEEIEPLIDDFRDILISKSIRTGYGKSPDYFINHYKEWKASIIKQFNVDRGNKEYWGSFYNGSLIALFTMVPINDTMIINNGSSHTDHLNKCPNDALRYIFLEYCKNLDGCKKVISGNWSKDKPSLNEFKESYGFEKVNLPVYAKYNFPVIKKIAALKQGGNFSEAIKSLIFKRKKRSNL